MKQMDPRISGISAACSRSQQPVNSVSTIVPFNALIMNHSATWLISVSSAAGVGWLNSVHTVLTAVERFQVFAIAPLNDVAADFHAGCQHLVVDAERLRGQFEAPDPLDCAQARVYTV